MMGSRKPQRSAKPSLRNPSGSLSSANKPTFKKEKKKPTKSNASDSKSKKRDKKKPKQGQKRPNDRVADGISLNNDHDLQPMTVSDQLKFFVDHYQSANNVQLSSLELEAINENCILNLRPGSDKDDKSLGKQIKAAFGSSWKEVLYEKNLIEGKVDPGSPVILILATSAIRAIEVLRGFRSLTTECHAAKLFAKHIKVEEQVASLKSRVNIAGGTPSRIKKLIELEALGLSRLSILFIDLHVDVKGYSLLTLPQVSDEFWDLYKNYFHQRLLDGNTRLCFYRLNQSIAKMRQKRAPEELIHTK
ncbi:hypothetical protein SAY86_003753 [Trapa natans]|uniref:Protein CMSS1 n=1 Tax=Trapa natans TaxID=22666 RepID=A0AAN7MHL1_TRANT|nr:hypothetical protein SAY86_003753 [Trapa natans]